ncbi:MULTISPECIES: hypothetical protein [unclassified Mucilaginibacter]|uniref:hypothetical protein n=1 Tax=unclassified Mucilaginibacter TaxID=2617802 RepID=UPI002AC9133D|nr:MULTISPECIES: hypothetical protein [unclassified Mucilaginibacter]MEB0262955.1 hypothetical protein [Mucilaginibacter sp. 10I4]MEB0277550.1 hypothetical protein [Mucilaginibacter sp. 10B2]MEB0299465.1 hypothetical protein [Mucilaginibacter sp. 5C4]WPX24821.1 hypothetical protein RHM67_06020 [Mucilaginibacter sp. 5C4]
MLQTPQFINGGSFSDERGSLSFVNHFSLDDVRRFYHIQPANTEIVRAWQGHKFEQKWFYVVAGSFKIVVVRPNGWENPIHIHNLYEYTVTELTGILHIPGGYANGFKALEPNSKLIVFSDFSVEQSAADECRFDKQLWYDWNKNEKYD